MQRVQQRGFTLVEVLIALTLMALLGLASATVFQQMIRAERSSLAHHDRLSELQRAFMLIERDFRQMMPRSIQAYQVEQSATEPLFLYHDEGFLESEAAGIMFVRGGWINPDALFPRAELQAVGYRLKEGVLERLTTPFVDALSAPQITPILTGVEDFELLFKGGQTSRATHQWVATSQLPEQVVVRIEHQQFGLIERVLLTSGAWPVEEK